MRIKEVIVVEGKDDMQAVKRAVEAELIITNGLSLPQSTIEKIKLAQLRTGVIVFTDPDYPGEKIRSMISQQVSGVKHAFLPKDQAIKKGDLGIENATPEHIREALAKVRTLVEASEPMFTYSDLLELGLCGSGGAAQLRERVGRMLGLGYANAKQFLSRLNNFGITRGEFIQAVETAIEEQSEV